jgi:hypothetical protein
LRKRRRTGRGGCQVTSSKEKLLARRKTSHPAQEANSEQPGTERYQRRRLTSDAVDTP